LHRDAVVPAEPVEQIEITKSNQKPQMVAFSNNLFHHFF